MNMAKMSTIFPSPSTEYNSWNDLPTSFGSRKRPSTGNKAKERAQQNRTDLDAEINQVFDKKFHFKPKAGQWKLAQPQHMFNVVKWKDHYLQKLKTKLNVVKNKLNDYDLDSWHRHTRTMNKAGEIHWILRNEIQAEFVTQAFCKFYENVMAFPLVPSNVGDVFCSVHLCEAPGAFITSLNHYLKTNRPNVKWDWLATTLNPHYEGNQLSSMINDDRFILQTLDHWNFGQDSTGNLMCLKNMMHLVEKAQARGPVMLVTADGSIDCQEDPGEQEAVVSRLHYCEAVAAMHILAPGGSFLLKMFTMYECDTICLMYLLCCAFKHVSVNKPATSKEGNSEVYVVCLEYRGVDFMQPWMKVLASNYGSDTLRNSMFLSFSMPEDFMDQIESCAEKFTNYQIEVIENNIWTFQRKNDNWYKIKKLRYLVAQHFVETLNIRRLPEEHEIVGRKILKRMELPNIEPRSEAGSFNDRRKRANLTHPELLSLLCQELSALDIQWNSKQEIKWLKFPEEKIEELVQTGKPVSTVYSSKFCLGKLLQILNRARQVTGRGSMSSSSDTSLTELTQSSDSLESVEPSKMAEQLREQYPDAIMLDFKGTLWSALENGSNSMAESSSFLEIKAALNELWRDSTLILVGYPMLTQFNVGVVYTAAHMFERVGFVRPRGQDCAVVLDKYRHWDCGTLKFLDCVAKYIEACQFVQSSAVLSILPIATVCGCKQLEADSLLAEDNKATLSNGPRNFYSYVLEVNNLCVFEQTAAIVGHHSISLQVTSGSDNAH